MKIGSYVRINGTPCIYPDTPILNTHSDVNIYVFIRGRESAGWPINSGALSIFHTLLIFAICLGFYGFDWLRTATAEDCSMMPSFLTAKILKKWPKFLLLGILDTITVLPTYYFLTHQNPYYRKLFEPLEPIYSI